MSDGLVAILVFVCLAGAGLGGLIVYDRLPLRHREDDTNAVVRLIANIFVVMTSLVFGFLINSAKTTFETKNDHDVHALSTGIILLDRSLREYGPQTGEARAALVAYLTRVVNDNPASDGGSIVASRASKSLLTETSSILTRLAPDGVRQTALWQEARQHLQRAIELRWTLGAASHKGDPAANHRHARRLAGAHRQLRLPRTQKCGRRQQLRALRGTDRGFDLPRPRHAGAFRRTDTDFEGTVRAGACRAPQLTTPRMRDAMLRHTRG